MENVEEKYGSKEEKIISKEIKQSFVINYLEFMYLAYDRLITYLIPILNILKLASEKDYQ